MVPPLSGRRQSLRVFFFGATVTYKDAAGLEHVVSIVGIDEVDLNRGYISWRSPVGDSPFTETDRGSGWNLRSQVRGTGGTPQ